jgi:hypothetical protein
MQPLHQQANAALRALRAAAAKRQSH